MGLRTKTMFLLLAIIGSYGHLLPYQPGLYQSSTAVNQPPNVQFSITCTSNGFSPNQCGAPGRIIEAKVTRQTSGSCRVYKTFGFVGSYLWVRQGCGGEFSVRYATNELNPNYRQTSYQQNTGYYNNYNNQGQTNPNCQYYNAQFPCASINNGYNNCKVPYEIVRVDVKQAYSSATCQFASSYGRTENGKIWVTNGCSAQFDVTFKVCHGQGDSSCKVSSTLVDCRGNRGYSDVTECELRFNINSIQLQRSANTALCQMSRAYGVSGNGVWVNKGCYGTFDVRCSICPGS